METKLTILKPFFEEPERKFSIRELSRNLKINHTTIRQHLEKLNKEGFLSKKKEGVYSFYNLILNKKTLNLKRYYNLEKIENSKIIQDLEKSFDFPIVVLFGSYCTATDDKKSDIDILIDFEPDKENFDNYMAVYDIIEKLFKNEKIEIVTKNGLSPYIGPKILKEVMYV